ncbi:9118_t:CDS:2 [Cetraspora pellucida]|uniref:9118_t:CDS:1 n=1 Tax=Cetraspora pellucida TaxID=1433469 RepID=A0A9N9ICK8_9GLOM|nr:9118_t:CDS:2 [Cetraspora pellucida]
MFEIASQNYIKFADLGWFKKSNKVTASDHKVHEIVNIQRSDVEILDSSKRRKIKSSDVLLRLKKISSRGSLFKQFKYAINVEDSHYSILNPTKEVSKRASIKYQRIYTGHLVINSVIHTEGRIENKPTTIPYFQHRLVDEISIIIFKYVESPMNLMLTCKNWYKISIDQQARAKWIIYKYGHAHALFYAIKLGPNFINLPVARAIIANKAIISRYFIQRLLLHFGKLDNDLVTLKMEYNSNSGRVNNTLSQNIQQSTKQPWASDLGMSVFLYILKMAAEQFSEMQLSLKGNDLELFHFLSAGPYGLKEAKIRYRSICEDVNRLVMKGALIMLFSPASATNWTPPNPEEVVERLSELIKLGFVLDYTVIVEILLIERQSVEIGNTMIKAFLQIKNESLEEFLHQCLIELFRAFRLDKSLKKAYVLDFLYSLIDKDHEEVFFKAMEFDLENRLDDNIENPFTNLKFPAFYYSWILSKFGPVTKITNWCFNDILEKRVNVDIFVQQHQQNYFLNEQPENNFKKICVAFKNYSNTINFFKPSHLNIIKQATNVDIIDGLKHYLTKLFMQQLQNSVECSDKIDIDNVSSFTHKRKRDDPELNNWYNEIRKLHYDLNSSLMSNEFSEFLKGIWEIINGSTFVLSRDADETDGLKE